MAEWQQITPPETEPVSLEDAKAQAHVYTDADDADIELYIAASRELTEKATRRQLITATWEMSACKFPDTSWFELPRPPLQSVSSIEYLDGAGALQTLDPELYTVNTRGIVGRVALKQGATWPATLAQDGAVLITFIAGYENAAKVPKLLGQGIKMRVAHWYRNRESTIEATLSRVADGPDRIDNLFRVPGAFNTWANW